MTTFIDFFSFRLFRGQYLKHISYCCSFDHKMLSMTGLRRKGLDTVWQSYYLLWVHNLLGKKITTVSRWLNVLQGLLTEVMSCW